MKRRLDFHFRSKSPLLFMFIALIFVFFFFLFYKQIPVVLCNSNNNLYYLLLIFLNLYNLYRELFFCLDSGRLDNIESLLLDILYYSNLFHNVQDVMDVNINHIMEVNITSYKTTSTPRTTESVNVFSDFNTFISFIFELVRSTGVSIGETLNYIFKIVYMTVEEIKDVYNVSRVASGPYTNSNSIDLLHCGLETTSKIVSERIKSNGYLSKYIFGEVDVTSVRFVDSSGKITKELLLESCEVESYCKHRRYDTIKNWLPSNVECKDQKLLKYLDSLWQHSRKELFGELIRKINLFPIYRDLCEVGELILSRDEKDYLDLTFDTKEKIIHSCVHQCTSQLDYKIFDYRYRFYGISSTDIYRFLMLLDRDREIFWGGFREYLNMLFNTKGKEYIKILAEHLLEADTHNRSSLGLSHVIERVDDGKSGKSVCYRLLFDVHDNSFKARYGFSRLPQNAIIRII